MPRPRRPLPLQLSSVKYDNQLKRYTFTEDGITYQFDLKHLDMMKALGFHTMREWYANQDAEIKKEITRIGLPPSDNDFYPDPEYED